MFEEIKENIYFIEGLQNAKYPYSNSILINGETENMLIDCGFGSKIIRKLRKMYKIDKILISHCHEDHTKDLRYLKNSKIYIHPYDRPGVESTQYLRKIYGIVDEKYDEMFNMFMNSIGFKEMKIYQTFEDHDIFDLGNCKIEIIHTPGHSAGHCCFFVHPDILFLSDIDLASFGPWYGAIDCNIQDFIDSIKKIMQMNTKIVVSSHKGIFKSNIKERLQIYLDKIYERDRIIIDNLGNGMTIDDLARKALIYGKFPEPKELFYIAEKIMLKKHLDNLVSNKKIYEKNGRYFV
ncbi:MAG: MBL fold metallo-hydrolase [Candidatus Helarchaeota archaeon]